MLFDIEPLCVSTGLLFFFFYVFSVVFIFGVLLSLPSNVVSVKCGIKYVILLKFVFVELATPA